MVISLRRVGRCIHAHQFLRPSCLCTFPSQNHQAMHACMHFVRRQHLFSFVPSSVPSLILSLALARGLSFRFDKSQPLRTLTRSADHSDPSPVPHPVPRRPSPSTWTRRSSCRTRVVATARSASTSPSSSRPRYGLSILNHPPNDLSLLYIFLHRRRRTRGSRRNNIPANNSKLEISE